MPHSRRTTGLLAPPTMPRLFAHVWIHAPDDVQLGGLKQTGRVYEIVQGYRWCRLLEAISCVDTILFPAVEFVSDCAKLEFHFVFQPLP